MSFELVDRGKLGEVYRLIGRIGEILEEVLLRMRTGILLFNY
jgi:hypothetical protein